MACCTAHDYAPGWVKQEDGSWMYRKDGDFVRDAWVYDGGRWYVFDGAGVMVTGWFRADKDWFFLADDGGMCSSQWVVDGDHQYYLTHSGEMARSAYVKSTKPFGNVWLYYWVNEKGEYEKKWDTAFPHLETYQLAY